MAAVPSSAWGIDIGNHSLKALRVRLTGDTVEVIGFDCIDHTKVLTSPDVREDERAELIAASLRQFAERNDSRNDDVVISVPGHVSFARFIKLPPVERKGIPKVVQYEAVQQIPFDINEVEWDWQIFEKPGSREVEVGIFAIKTELVKQQLEHFARENIRVTCVQMAPMALYNYVVYDRKDLGQGGSQGLIVVDMGAENTDLVICTDMGVWQRSIPLGGNAFTRAIAEAFRLNFAKAEKLKMTAPMSKYARQILQAMKPVFADLATEIQRSLGFYTSSNRQTRLTRVIALGGGTRLQGLTKFLQQTLQRPVVRPDSFERLVVGQGVSAAKFHENVCDFGTVYGLALQGLGLGKIESNLLPRKVARMMMWSRKSRYFAAAAVVVVLGCVLCFARAAYDRARYRSNSDVRADYTVVLREAEEAVQKLEAERKKGQTAAAEIDRYVRRFRYRDAIARLNGTLIACLPSRQNNPEQASLYQAFADGDAEAVMSYPRKQRKQLFVTSVSISYADDLAAATFGERMGSTYQPQAQPSPVPGGAGLSGTPPGFMLDMMRRGPGDGRFGEFGPGGMPMGPFGEKMGRGAARVAPASQKPAEQTEAKQAAGFVVVIEGYSPYENVMDLLHPVGASEDRSQWGVVTRFNRLRELFPDCPFELYSLEHEHFKIERGPVDVSASGMPAGIGAERMRGVGGAGESVAAVEARPALLATGGIEKIMVDPLTEEVVSRVVERDEKGQPVVASPDEVKYQVNDYWYRVKAKFIWKDAPEEARPKPEVSQQAMEYE
jgi:type IV pilus assembly protein PilM